VQEVLADDAGWTRKRPVLPLVGEDEVDVPERERRQRLLGLGLDQLAAEAGCLPCKRLHRRHGDVERGGLEGCDPPPPRDAAPRRGQLGLREPARSSSAPAWPTRTSAASVSLTPRPAFSTGYEGSGPTVLTEYTEEGAHEIDLPESQGYGAVIDHVVACLHGDAVSRIDAASVLDTLQLTLDVHTALNAGHTGTSPPSPS
jgi:hypothetical protein